MMEKGRLTGGTEGGSEEARLSEEIVLFAERLRRFGGDGDCAYDRALNRLYQSLVNLRLLLLADLRAAGL